MGDYEMRIDIRGDLKSPRLTTNP
eukprot:COSAG01_NODE_73703_length_238_cov_23.647482_1_plen_23_part_01